MFFFKKKRRKYSSAQHSPTVDKRASRRATDQPVHPHLLYERLEKHLKKMIIFLHKDFTKEELFHFSRAECEKA